MLSRNLQSYREVAVADNHKTSDRKVHVLCFENSGSDETFFLHVIRGSFLSEVTIKLCVCMFVCVCIYIGSCASSLIEK